MGTIPELEWKIDESYLPNFLVIKPEDYPGLDPRHPKDIFKQTMRIIRGPWAEEEWGGRKAAGITFDTTGEMAWSLARMVGQSGMGGGSGPIYGEDIDLLDPGSYRAHRFQDYQDAQGLTLSLIKSSLTQMPQLDVFHISHRDASYEQISKTDRRFTGFGFQTVGSKHTLTVGKAFNEFMWMENRAGGGDRPDIWIHLEGDYEHQGKVRARGDVIDKPVMHVPFSREGMAEVWRELAKFRQIDIADPKSKRFRTGIYAPSGWGKTYLVCSQPPEFFERGFMVYLAFDPGSEYLDSVWPEIVEP